MTTIVNYVKNQIKGERGGKRYNVIYDFGSGFHEVDIISIEILDNKLCNLAIGVDNNYGSKKEFSLYMGEHNPKFLFFKSSVRDFSTKHTFMEDSLIVSRHACEDLAKEVIDIAIEQSLPFIIVPCCSGPIPKSYLKGRDATYEIWVNYLTSLITGKGYDLKIKPYEMGDKLLAGTPK